MKNKKHPWDETMVIVVMVVSALAILVMLASYITSVGQAYSTLPSDQGIKSLLASCQITEGSGKMRGTIACGKVQKNCVLAWENDVLKTCKDKIQNNYRALCCSPQFLVSK
tara:strand:+ start:312 stop:644 length:333 start_codon:yes stop_codon:yes gene_type:complete